MSFWPKSHKARRRLTIVLAAAPVLALAVGLTLYGLRENISLFLTPGQVAEAPLRPGKTFQLGGMVEVGSLKVADGRNMTFRVVDNQAGMTVIYDGEVTSLFREGQGVVAEGSLRDDGVFVAKRVLAKHDEKYMPREVSKALKEQGEWRGEGQRPDHDMPKVPRQQGS
ncbi:cytochrome c maturation protein CcmE [Caulobacter sp. SLTY]|uniref:cytochrome c maturation protein CcmE n=1 Tax=Caulobacter sp. SLTY TaxID=2683262 RepID=UPI0014127A8F|nr:cytochrome c maturation protein CcmE [Caulobacter sp. SLTY]NBB15315.1 cytochrome c maturation protein CcmE [Caulobacter sp. SLTY]